MFSRKSRLQALAGEFLLGRAMPPLTRYAAKKGNVGGFAIAGVSRT